MEEQQMPCWYFEKEELNNTPSRKDNIDKETEDRYRNEGARFIIDCGKEMNLRFETCATGIVFFHRFYMFHSFKEFHRYLIGSACLFLAGKVEETPKKCRHIVRQVEISLKEHQFSSAFGKRPTAEIITAERILLKTIKFDLQVAHPYKYLLQYVKKIKVQGDREVVNNLAQISWTFINDSLCTTLCLQWEPEILACAVLYLATRLKPEYKIEDWEDRKPGQKWWECFVPGMTLEVLEDVCHQILDLYPTGKDSGTSGAKAAANAASKKSGWGQYQAGSVNKKPADHSSSVNQSTASSHQKISTVPSIVTGNLSAPPSQQHNLSYPVGFDPMMNQQAAPTYHHPIMPQSASVYQGGSSQYVTPPPAQPPYYAAPQNTSVNAGGIVPVGQQIYQPSVNTASPANWYLPQQQAPGYRPNNPVYPPAHAGTLPPQQAQPAYPGQNIVRLTGR